MKKILASLLVLALCAPAMADVTVTTDVSVAGEATITLTAGTGEAIVGIGMLVDATAGQVDSYSVDSFFDIFMDIAYDEVGGDGYDYGEGANATMLSGANPAGPGQTVTLPTADQFSISVGGLGGAAAPLNPAPQIAQIVLRAAGGATVDLDLDTLRGGIVGSAGAAHAVTGLPTTITIAPGGGSVDCIDSGSSFYQDWLGSAGSTYTGASWSKPDCWCYERNCNGDADGLKQGTAKGGYRYVYTNDLTILSGAYAILEVPKGDGITADQICADFARDQQGTAKGGYRRVYTNDLTILSTNYAILEPDKGPGVPLCPLTTSGGDIVEYKYPAP